MYFKKDQIKKGTPTIRDKEYWYHQTPRKTINLNEAVLVFKTGFLFTNISKFYKCCEAMTNIVVLYGSWDWRWVVPILVTHWCLTNVPFPAY